jgi:hypothetical protein
MMIATIEEYPKARYPFKVKALPDHARSAADVQVFNVATWEEARAKIEELKATPVTPARFNENVMCLSGQGAPPAAVDYERLQHGG